MLTAVSLSRHLLLGTHVSVLACSTNISSILCSRLSLAPCTILGAFNAHFPQLYQPYAAAAALLAGYLHTHQYVCCHLTEPGHMASLEPAVNITRLISLVCASKAGQVHGMTINASSDVFVSTAVPATGDVPVLHCPPATAGARHSQPNLKQRLPSKCRIFHWPVSQTLQQNRCCADVLD